MAENEYRCEGCNGIMQFDAVSQTLKCPNCGNVIEIVSDKEVVEHKLTIDAKRTIRYNEKSSKTMECTGCGAHIEVPGNDTTAKCPYCDSTYVLAKNQEDVLIPDGVIPFKIDKKDLGQKFADWIKKKWLAPNELKNLYQRDCFQGIYAPYWTFDADADCRYSAKGGRNTTHTTKDSDGNVHTTTTTTWYPTSGRVHRFFDDLLIPASKRFTKGLFTGLEPYDFNEVKAYSPDYFSGYISENYSVDLETGHSEAKLKMNAELRDMCRNDVLIRYDEVKDVRMNPVYKDETYKYLMLPIYSTSYHYKDKQYTVLFNGQTGRIKGEYPKSPVKIAIIVAVILAIFGIMFGIACLSGGDESSNTGYNDIHENVVETASQDIDNDVIIFDNDYSVNI